MTEQFCVHAKIEGRVQGVGFRYFVLTKAQSLNLTGWVRNTYDDKVEVLAEGNRDELESLLIFLRKGPQSAFVSNIKISWDPATGKYQNFFIAPSF